MSNKTMAHCLAENIMVSHAREIARRINGKEASDRWQDYYDPLAAVCLGDLIYTVMTKRGTHTNG